MKTNQSGTKKLFILSAVLLILAILGYMYVFTLIKNLSVQNANLETTYAQSLESNTELSEAKIANDQGLSYKNQLSSHFIGQGDQASLDFVNYLEKTAASFGLQYSIETVDAVDDPNLSGSGLGNIQITFKTNGKWTDTIKFVSMLENTPYSLNIARIDLDVKTPTTSSKPATVKNVSGAGAGYVWQGIYRFSVVKVK